MADEVTPETTKELYYGTLSVVEWEDGEAVQKVVPFALPAVDVAGAVVEAFSRYLRTRSKLVTPLPLELALGGAYLVKAEDIAAAGLVKATTTP